MTMFTRNDKATDANAAGTAPTSTRVEITPPAVQPVEPRRPTATVPITTATTPTPAAATASVPGVSVISKALKITGQLESTEDIQIDGEVEGDVRGLSVSVGSNARVKGTVYGEKVELSGSVDGKIEAKKVVLTRTAHMSGDIIHQDITIESGAFIDGHCRPQFGKPEAKSTTSKPAGAVREQIAADRSNGLGSSVETRA
jgi:cytoskeletal protein CcmA (bactofilin family)